MIVLPPESPDVLFASYGGGHVTMLQPVASAMARAGMSTTFLGLTTAQAYLERQGMDCFGFAELDDANDPQVQAWGKELAGAEAPNAAVPYRETVAYHGLSFRDLVERMGEPAAREHYYLHGRQGFLPVATMQRMLEKLRPRLVVATNSPRTERALFLAARNLGIKALCLVDMFALQEVEWICQPGYADTICVLNDEVRRMFVERGCREDTVVVTGNPAFDSLTSEANRAAGALLRQQKGYGSNDEVVLWASNVEPERHPFTGALGDPELPPRIEAELRRVVAKHSNWHLVVRYHPSETAIFEPGPHVTLSRREDNLHALLNAVDVVVVISSTVGLEAHLVGRPVVSVDLSVFTADAPFSKMGIASGVGSLSELENAIVVALSNRAGKSVNSLPESRATTAVYRQICALIGNAAP